MSKYGVIKLYRSSPSTWTAKQVEQWNKYYLIMGAPFIAGKEQYYNFGAGVPVDIRLGSLMWKFVKDGVITKIDGLELIDNYVRVTKAYLDSILDVNPILDEEGKETGEFDEITIRDAFPPTKENSTHGLIKLTVDNWQKLESKFQHTTVEKHGDTIDNYPVAIYSDKNYLEAIKEGGEFYIKPVNQM